LKPQTPFLFATLIVPLLLSCIGCNTTRNIANDPNYPTDYKLNRLYSLKKPVFVERLSDNDLVLQKPGKTGAVPSSPEQYTTGDKKNWPTVVALLEPGTKLKVIKIQLEKNFETGNIIWISAQIIDGALAAKQVELLFISKQIQQNRPSASITTIDPTYLAPIEN